MGKSELRYSAVYIPTLEHGTEKKDNNRMTNNRTIEQSNQTLSDGKELLT
jgi:hypothetical protein